MGLGLVEGDVGFVDFVVEVVLEDAAWVCWVPFLGDEFDLFEDGFLVCVWMGGWLVWGYWVIESRENGLLGERTWCFFAGLPQ